MRYKLAIFFCWIFLFNSCKKESMCDCVKSTRVTNVIYHDVKDFNCIFIRDKMDLYLTQGPEFEVSVEAGENLQRLIKTELEGETLKVFNNNRCNFVRGYDRKIRVYITAPYFKYIQNAGLGTIETTNTIVQDEIKLRTENSGDLRLYMDVHKIVASAHGNGDMYLAGTTDILEHDYTGTNYLYATGLYISSYAYLHSVSIGHAYINAPENGLMDIIIDRAGDIYFKGNPASIRLTRNGKGELIRQ